jgi:4'-phosphopantetheinyl transferase
MPTRRSRPEAAEVCVHYASIDALGDRPELGVRARELLSEAERVRHDRFRHEVDRRMFLLGRIMARVLVGRALGCDPLAWTWREGPRGRPEIGHPPSPVRFNLAHSAGLVVCALASGREVGVDVEDLNRRAPEPGIVERYCAPAEVADIAARGEDWNGRFLVYWTLKEAYLKARGLGIAVPLAEISFSVDDGDEARIGFLGSLVGTDDRWSFALVRPTSRHLMAVAASKAGGPAPNVTLQAFDPEANLTP